MPRIDNETVLVTGGAGFIGTHLCERLLADGQCVTCVDNFVSAPESNVSHLRDSKAFQLVEHDITVPFTFAADRVYNLACPASPARYQLDPVGTARTNVLGALNLLEAVRNLNIPILQASTSEVYGDPLFHPQQEFHAGNVHPIGPRACYDEGKRFAETLFHDYHRQFHLSVRIARIFNTYGPRMLPDDGRVVSTFIVQALRNKPITVYGQGTQTRSFCYVDDTVAGLIALSRAGDTMNCPVNIGNPEEITISELANMVLDLTNSRSKVVHRPLPVHDPARRCPDISLARSALGWTPRVSLREGLERTIIWFDTLLGSSIRSPSGARGFR